MTIIVTGIWLAIKAVLVVTVVWVAVMGIALMRIDR